MKQAKEIKPKVVEIEAMDDAEWEREWGAGHETPEASAEGVATLVRQSAQAPEPPTALHRKTANVAATIPRSSVPAMATVTPRATPLPMRSVDPPASGPTQPRPQPQRRMPLPAPNEVPIMGSAPGVAPVPGLAPLPGLPPQHVLEIDAELPQAMHMPRMTSAAEHIQRRADATPNRVPGTLDAIDEMKLSARPSKRALAIAGGALAVGALVIVFAMTRGGGGDKAPAAPQPAAAAAPATPAPAQKPAPKTDTKLDETIAKTDESIRQGNAVVNDEAEAAAKPEPPKAEPAPAKPEPVAKPAPVAKAAPAATKPAPVAKAVAKAPAKPQPVALAKPRPASAPIAASSARPTRTVTKPAAKPAAKRVAAAAPANDLEGARAAYGDGNQALFAGNADEAIHAYQRALASSATYASGYRGLGLAYAEKGDNASAIKALRKYLELAPRARDAVLVQKRIEMLKQSPAKSRSTR